MELFTVCAMSGAGPLVSKQGMGKTARLRAILRLFGGGGPAVTVWRWDSEQANPPVRDQVLGKLSGTSRGWFSKKNPSGSSVESGCSSTAERRDCFQWEARIWGWLTEQRVSSPEWGRLLTYVQKPESHPGWWGINLSASRLHRHTEEVGGDPDWDMWPFSVRFPEAPAAVSQGRVVTPGLPSLDSCRAHRRSRQATWLLLLSAGECAGAATFCQATWRFGLDWLASASLHTASFVRRNGTLHTQTHTCTLIYQETLI